MSQDSSTGGMASGHHSMNTSSESPGPLRPELNAQDGASVPSSYETDELFLQAITALQRAMQAAWKVTAREALQTLNPDHPTTQDREVVSPFMQRLTLYYGLIAVIAMELQSIAPIPPATDASGSSKARASSVSSPQWERLTSSDPEPLLGSIVVDDAGDVWQRKFYGWSCTESIDGTYKDWTWDKLANQYRVYLIHEGDPADKVH